MQTKYGEHGSHVIVMKLRLGELDTSIWVNWRMGVLNIVHPSCVYLVETLVNLVKLILQIKQCDINMDLK